MCNCKFCAEGREFRQILERLSNEKDRKFMEKFYEDKAMVEDERDYYYSILAGDWPTSVQHLTKALEQAKAKGKEYGYYQENCS